MDLSWLECLRDEETDQRPEAGEHVREGVVGWQRPEHFSRRDQMEDGPGHEGRVTKNNIRITSGYRPGEGADGRKNDVAAVHGPTQEPGCHRGNSHVTEERASQILADEQRVIAGERVLHANDTATIDESNGCESGGRPLLLPARASSPFQGEQKRKQDEQMNSGILARA